MDKQKVRYIFDEIYSFLTNRQFIMNVLGMMAFLAFVLIVVFSWLRLYTNHGQKLSLPDYVDQTLDSSISDAKSKSFEIIVNDSVHIVGKNGGIIQNQNPKGGSLVKEKRKIYVTITKYKADQVNLSEDRFFGEDYAQIQAFLRTKSVNSTIKEYKFDRLTQNSVLEVWYKGKMVRNNRPPTEALIVDKGETLSFVVSSSDGGSSEVPDLIGSTVEEAMFILESTGLTLEFKSGGDQSPESVKDLIIIDQNPQRSTSLARGSAIVVELSRS